MNTVRREVDLICKIKNIPEKLEVDLTGLEVGAVVHMSDIKLQEDVVTQISDRDFTIATIAAPTVMAVEEEKPETEGEEEGEESTETAEGAETKEGEESKPAETKEESKKEEDPKK